MENEKKDALLRELKEREDRYRSVTETSIDAIVTSDDKDTILTWNRGAQSIFGHDADIVGRSVETIIPERYREAHRRGVKRYLETGEKHLIGKKLELAALHRDQTEFPIELSLSSWESPSGVFFGGIIRDISERRQIERIREDVQRMLRHDLKSPLIGMTGLAGRLQKASNLTESQKKTAALIQQTGEKTLRLIDRSRDLFQMEQGTYELSPQPVNLLEILERISQELQPLALKKAVTISREASGKSVKEKIQRVTGDSDLLEMMFANLLKNAIEASPDKQEVTITIHADGGRDSASCVVDIYNRTPVPEEMRDCFFEAYATSGKKGGTGLGTYNALLIAKTHGGNIRYTTSKKDGTHVIVSLPFEHDQKEFA